MKVPPFPVFDNHLHLRESGGFLESARRFKAAGGTGFLLVHDPDLDWRDGKIEWAAGYAKTIAMAQKVRDEVGLQVWPVVGPYPVTLVRLAESMPLPQVEEFMRKGTDLALRLFEEKKIVAMGEVGRPHFPVSPEIWDASNRTMLYCMERARDAGCPLQLHTESSDETVFADLAQRCDAARFPRERAVKHFSPPIANEKNHGLFPSVIASRDNIRTCLRDSPECRFVLETDFIDDPGRPGAVLPIETIPKRALGLWQNGELSEEQGFRIFQRNPRSLYGIESERKE